MENSKLTGIERELVLQYLIDGNVPVTLTPLEETAQNNDDIIKPVSSQIFPVAIKGENVKVSKSGLIILENTSQAAANFSNKTVKVEFYFNRVGLYFTSFVQETEKGLALELPDTLNRIQDVVEDKNYDFSAIIYFECKTGKELNLKCYPWGQEELFSRPAWKTIPLENQKTAKQLLEGFVEQAKIEKNAGTGIQLIPVCNYLTFKHVEKMEAMENRPKALSVLYVDHQRIVLGLDYTSYTFTPGDEYGIKLQFSIKNGPILTRDVFVTGKVNKIYKTDEERVFCVDLVYTTLQEEDLRYLYEKATKTLFI